MATTEDFKTYVHRRLDEMGIEKDPESVHKAAGCRIGGRLDIVEKHVKRSTAEDKLLSVTSPEELDILIEHCSKVIAKLLIEDTLQTKYVNKIVELCEAVKKDPLQAWAGIKAISALLDEFKILQKELDKIINDVNGMYGKSYFDQLKRHIESIYHMRKL